MAVSFTPNIGLAKPDGTELAANWTRLTEIYTDNNGVLVTKMDLPIQVYTPTIIAQTSNPNTGVGVGTGSYIDFEGYIMGGFIIPFTDPGVAAGSGEYGIKLPAVVNNTFHTVGSALNGTVGLNSVIGNGYLNDLSSVATSGALALDAVTVTGISYARLITEVYTSPTKTARLVTNSQPTTVATGDGITGFFVYKKL
jgi:hypothetical protein